MVGHVASTALEESVALAQHRRIGQSWQWSRVDSDPLLMAATLARRTYKASVAAPPAVPMIW
jgi:hypothetical protein